MMAGDGFRRAAHLWRTMALLLFLAAVAWSGPGWAGGDVSPSDAHAAAAAGERSLIDVRSPSEWRQTGVPQGARTVSIHQKADSFLAEMLTAAVDDRDAPIALICATGQRSSRARAILEAQGFTNVVSVAGGIYGAQGAPGWLKDGLAIEPCKSC